MNASESETKPAVGWRAWGWSLALASLIVTGGWEAIGAGGPSVEPPVAESLPDGESDDTSGDIFNVYGLTPTDLGLIAASARRSDARVIVAGSPGRKKLAGPLLTRSDAIDRHLPGKAARKRANVVELGGGWKQISFPDSAPDGRPPTLSTADVRVLDRETGSRHPCPRLGLRTFSCADPGWARVEPRKIKIGENRQRCIWAHPLKGRTIVVDYGRVDPADGAPYRLRTAIRDRVADNGGPVDVQVEFGSRKIDATHRPEKGWQQTELPRIDTPSRLQITISAEKVGQRHFCFQLSGR